MNQEPELSPTEKLVEEIATTLLRNLTGFSAKVHDKYEYYGADENIRDMGISTPAKLVSIKPGIGWASRAVNTLSDRVVFDGFAKDTFGINEYLDDINGYSVINQSKHDTFIAGCSFIAVAHDSTSGKKMLIPFTAEEATGSIDQKTGLLKYGLVVTAWDKSKGRSGGLKPKDYVVFTPTLTAVFEGRTLSQIVENPTGRTLLHPITHRASAKQPLGKSRLTKTARRIIQEVGRLKRREEIAEEFYALPQRYINGLAQGADKDPKLDSAIGKVWAITKDDEGDTPDIGQLQQMSIEGFIGAKKDKARDFCAETALTLRNLGYETGNPTSAESLSAMSDDLLLEAQTTQIEMGEQIKQLVITLRMAIDEVDLVPDALNNLVPSWKPIFQVNVGAAGDSLYKLQQVMPELIGTVQGYQMLGVGIRDAEELARRRQEATSKGFMINGGGQ